ncbi:MAG: Ig-like domain-containing protein [Turneriella sp.]
MSKKSFVISFLPVILFACGGGFEKFAPPANSISGRGAKQKPKIISTTPSDGASVSPVTGTTGSQIRVIFDMTMNTSTTPVINTYVRDIESSTGWYSIANSGTTFTWSSTNFGNDTLTIQLGWVRWPENNIIGFDFRNETLINLDEMPLDNEKFTRLP